LKKELEKLAENPTLFAELLLNFKPYPYQQKLLNDKSKRIVACMGRQTGKTTTIAAKAIHYAYTHPNTTTLIVSPSLRQSMIMFDKIQNFIQNNPLLTKSITRKTRTIIQLTNHSQIIALPCSQNLLRGYTAQLTICDEAAFIPETVITQIIFPMLSTTNGTAIFLSTPWDKNHFFHKAFLNPKYSTHKVKSKQCPLIKPEFLKEMQQNMTKEAYLMEYEAEFTETQNSYFPQELIRKSVEHAQKINLELRTNLPKRQLLRRRRPRQTPRLLRPSHHKNRKQFYKTLLLTPVPPRNTLHPSHRTPKKSKPKTPLPQNSSRPNRRRRTNPRRNPQPRPKKRQRHKIHSPNQRKPSLKHETPHGARQTCNPLS